MLWPRPRNLSAIVRLVSVLIPLWLRRRICPPCFRRVPAMAKPCPPFVSASCVSTTCVRHVPALCPPCARSLPAQVHHVSSPLDFVRSWPAVGQGRDIVKKNFVPALRDPPLLYCKPAGPFAWHSFYCERALCLKNCLGSMLV